jgi:hypothetical protein
MKKGETKCKSCDTKTDEPCDLANYTTEIDGKTYTFCCQIRAKQYKKEKAKEKKKKKNQKKKTRLYYTISTFNFS